MLLATALAARAQALYDDKTWSDEDYVMAGSLGLSWESPFPSSFTHSEVWNPSLSRCLTFLAERDAYPPLQYLAIYLARDAAHPLLTLRLAFVGLSLLVPILIFVAARSATSSWQAALISGLVALSPGLAETSQQVKWSAFAPFLATLSSLLLVMAIRGRSAKPWIAYGIATSSLLHTHYLCASVVPSHALWLAIVARSCWRPFLATWVGIAVVCAPWFLFGLPAQREYLVRFFDGLRVEEGHPWARPLTLTNLGIWLTYNVLAAVGGQPSDIRARYLLVMSPLVAVALYAGARSQAPERRRLCTLGFTTYSVSLLAQTLYATHLGHTTPLTWSYLVHWFPFLCLALGLGFSESGGLLRYLGLSGLLALNALNLARHHFPPQIANTHSLSRYGDTVELLAAEAGAADALAYLNEGDAKKFNLYYRGSAQQFIGWPDATDPRLGGVERLIWIAPTGSAIPRPTTSEWSAPRQLASFGSTSVSTSCREQLPHCP